MKKGNKPFADDLEQLRNNPDDFQSDEAGSGFMGLLSDESIVRIFRFPVRLRSPARKGSSIKAQAGDHGLGFRF